jgi:hypothetical protein
VTSLGIGLGVVHPGRKSGVLYSANFTVLSAGAVASLPSGVLFSRASSGHSVQTGTSALLTSGGFTANDIARAGRRLDAWDLGLLLEESRTNSVHLSRDDGSSYASSKWVAGHASTTQTFGHTGPDGAASAARAVVSSGGYSRAPEVLTPAGTYVHSQWVKSGGTGIYSHIFASSLTTGVAARGAVGDAWIRVALSPHTTGGGARYGTAVDGQDTSAIGGGAAIALTGYYDLSQSELGRFATSNILTTAGAVTRAGERLYHASAADLFDAGRINLRTKLRPMGAAADYGSHYYLGRFDGNNFARINNSTRRIEVVRGGVTVYNPAEAISFNAHDLVEIQLAAGGASLQSFAKYRTNGGAWTNLTADVPAGAFTPSGAWDWLCAGTANQFTGWVYVLESFAGGVVLS